MGMPTSSCDPDALRELLDGSLADPDRTTLMHHLDTCSDCQQRLERFAADPHWWDEATSSLRIVLARAGGESPTTSSPTAEAMHGGTDYLKHYLQPARHPESLGRLGEYEVSELIGRGGMGLVAKAYDATLHRYVAIKVLSPELASSAAARQRFAREARAAAAVVHAHVVPIHSVNGSDELPYLVMPFIGGESLQRRIERLGPLPTCDVLRIALQAARGLSAAHEQGLVHRDVKPANILLENDVDRVLLTDFGLARTVDEASLTVSGVIAGTPQYMSPEQARGEAVDARSDLFSLGSVMYAMCTGHSPFRAETTMGVLHRICNAVPRPIRELNPAIPEWLEHVVVRLLAKDPGQRFGSAAELAELLGQCLAHVQHPTTLALPAALAKLQPRTRHWQRRLAIAASVLIVPLIFYLISNGLGLRRAESARHQTSPDRQQDVAEAPSPSRSGAGKTWQVSSSVERELVTIDQSLRAMETQIDAELSAAAAINNLQP